MKKTTIREIAEAVGGKILCGDPQCIVECLSIDSRTMQGNDLFIPIIGEKADAHRFIDQAFSNGAVATLTSRHETMDDPEHPYIAVEDTVKALHEIGRMCRAKAPVPAVGVTGSVGKTTTREMVAAALAGGKKVFKTSKNYNSRIGTPITMSLLDDTADMAVFELGMNVPGELGSISELAKLDMAVITNVGVAHIEFYGSQEKICEEKLTITWGLKEGGLLFLNGDDAMLYDHRNDTGHPVILYGLAEHNDYRAEDIQMVHGKMNFTMVHGEVRVPVQLSVLGSHNVLNALAALAVADHAGVPLEAAAKSLQEFKGFQNRLQLFTFHDWTLIDDTYNASPDSMKSGLKVLLDMEDKGKKIAVLGDMFELGIRSEEIHRGVGKHVATLNLDELITVGENAKFIEEEAKNNGGAMKFTHFDSNLAIAEYLKETMEPEDVVYLKAANGMKLKEITQYFLNE